MVTWCVCETAHLDCAGRTEGAAGLAADPLFRPLSLVLGAALLTCALSVSVFMQYARRDSD